MQWILLCLLLFVGACGQKGPLTLPADTDEQPTKQQSGPK